MLPVIEPQELGFTQPPAINPALAAEWLEAFLKDEIVAGRSIQRAVVGLSGGVDSAVAAMLVHRAIGDQHRGRGSSHRHGPPVHRGRGLRVQGEREGADAVIEGVIKSFSYGGVLLDDKGRARVFEVTIEAAVTVRDQTENRVLYDNQNFVFRGEYEFANDPRNFFNEEDPAVQRMARNFAESIVSTLTNAIQISK